MKRSVHFQYSMRFLLIAVTLLTLISCNKKDTVHFIVTELDGTHKTIEPKEKGFVFLFLAPDCPFSLGSSAELNSLYKQYDDIINIVAIIPGKLYTDEERDEYVKQYAIKFPVLFDSDYSLTRMLNATVMPEAFVLSPDGKAVYKGAINDKAFDTGKQKIAASEFYVLNVIKALAGNEEIKQKNVQAHGCFIE